MIGGLIAYAAAAVQAVPTPLTGVWEGTVGTLPVRACFVEREWGPFGAYYYRSHLRAIGLESVDGAPGTLREGGEGSGEVRWQIQSATSTTLQARWTSGRRVLPVRMTRVATEDGEEGPCASLAFHGPRLAGIRTTSRRATVDGVAYTIVALDTGDRYDASVETFALDGNGDATRRINETLARPLTGNPPTWFGCMSQSLETSPWEGDLNERYEPVMISRRWLSVNNNYDGSCGGAHPSSGLFYDTYDLSSGVEVDLHDWFDAAAVERDRVEGSDDVLKKVLPPLRQIILAGWNGEGECREVVTEAEYWHIGLRRDGFVFSPSLPHVAQACAEEYDVPFDRVRQFLTRDGAANVAALR